MKEGYEQMAQARERLIEPLHHLQHRLAYKKRAEVVLEIVAQLEEIASLMLLDQGGRVRWQTP